MLVFFFRVRGDSELVIKQANGVYKVKSPLIVPLNAHLQELKPHFPNGITYTHVRREMNAQADEMANYATSRRESLNEYYLSSDHQPLRRKTDEGEIEQEEDDDSFLDLLMGVTPEKEVGTSKQKKRKKLLVLGH